MIGTLRICNHNHISNSNHLIIKYYIYSTKQVFFDFIYIRFNTFKDGDVLDIFLCFHIVPILLISVFFSLLKLLLPFFTFLIYFQSFLFQVHLFFNFDFLLFYSFIFIFDCIFCFHLLKYWFLHLDHLSNHVNLCFFVEKNINIFNIEYFLLDITWNDFHFLKLI